MLVDAALCRDEVAWSSYTALNALAFIVRDDLIREMVTITRHTLTETSSNAGAPMVSESLVAEFLQLQGVGIPEGYNEFVVLHNRLIDWVIERAVHGTEQRSLRFSSSSADSTSGATLLSEGHSAPRPTSPPGRSISHAATFQAWEGSSESFHSRRAAGADLVLVNTTEDAPVMTAAEAHAASLNAQDIHASSRSPSAQVMRAGGRPSPHGMSGGSLERAGESVDHGPKLRPPGPHASSEGGEGGESGQGGGEVSPSVGPPAPAMSSENQLIETNEGRRLGPQLTSLQQQNKTKRFRERRLSKDLQETLQGNGADLKSQQQEQEVTVAVADAEGSALSVEAAAEEADSPPTLPADESEADRNASVDARIDGKGIDGEPLFKDNQGSPSPSFSKTLSPVKKTMRLDIGKSGLPVDRGGHSGRKSIAISSEIEELVEDAVTPFDRSLVGTYSCHGAEPTATGSTAKINQDCACLTHPFARTPGTALFCVYDGHGKFGHVVSQEVLHSLLYELEENNERLQQDPAVLLAESFENVNVHLRLCAQEQPYVVDAADSGACAIVVWMRGRELVVAGAGDCRAVLGTRHDKQLVSVCLSTDHKVNLPVEQARIEAAGGWVRPETGDNDDFNPARLYEVEGKPWLGPGLCIARCLGDLKANKCGLIPTPEICMHTLQSTDLFLILASDGVWEFIDNDEAVAIVGQFYDKGLPALDACRFLIAKAALCWRKFEGDYRDDITAIVVYLPKIVTALEQEQMKYSQVSSDQATGGP